MTNEEMMQLMTEMGLHEGGMENWVPDNAWLLVANKAIEIECKKHEATINFLTRLVDIYKAEIDSLHQAQKNDLNAAIRARG